MASRKPVNRKGRRSEAQREEERRQIENDGGWYLHIRRERERRELEAKIIDEKRIVTYPKRIILGRDNHENERTR